VNLSREKKQKGENITVNHRSHTKKIPYEVKGEATKENTAPDYPGQICRDVIAGKKN